MESAYDPSWALVARPIKPQPSSKFCACRAALNCRWPRMRYPCDHCAESNHHFAFCVTRYFDNRLTKAPSHTGLKPRKHHQVMRNIFNYVCIYGRPSDSSFPVFPYFDKGTIFLEIKKFFRSMRATRRAVVIDNPLIAPVAHSPASNQPSNVLPIRGFAGSGPHPIRLRSYQHYCLLMGALNN